MTIYIETFVLQNILINLCLLQLVKLTTKQSTTFFKFILASVIGAGFSVFAAIFITNLIIINLFKLLCSFIMITLAFKQTKKQFAFNLILLFAYTYALGGAIISLSGSAYSTSFGVVVSSKINMEAICLAIIILTYILELITKHLKFKIKTNNYIYPITIQLNTKKIKINAYLDTGNLLSFNGNPVIVLDLDCYLKLTNSNLINFCLAKGENLSVGTITGASNLKIFKIDQLTIHLNKKQIKLKNQYIGVNEINSFYSTNYKALLSPLLL